MFLCQYLILGKCRVNQFYTVFLSKKSSALLCFSIFEDILLLRCTMSYIWQHELQNYKLNICLYWNVIEGQWQNLVRSWYMYLRTQINCSRIYKIRILTLYWLNGMHLSHSLLYNFNTQNITSSTCTDVICKQQHCSEPSIWGWVKNAIINACLQNIYSTWKLLRSAFLNLGIYPRQIRIFSKF